jgi:hypothetical protein
MRTPSPTISIPTLPSPICTNHRESVVDPPRFTLDGSDRLEAHLAHVCEVVRDDLRKLIPGTKLEGLLLAGGYGRGEGGVLRTPTGDQPYNDLEFYACLRGHPRLNEWLLGSTLEVLGKMLTPIAGVEVEFKVLSLARLRRSPVSMFTYDMVMGHRWLIGGERLLAGCEHHSDPAHIPLHEATRLLLNRCTGLLFARQRLERTSLSAGDADYTARNLAKAQLGFGDVLLTAHGQYHWSCRERSRRLEAFKTSADPPWLDDLKQHHREGVRFKLHPERAEAARSSLQARLTDLTGLGRHVWLWLESRRLRSSFVSIEEYVSSPLNKCPETTAWRNALANLRAFGLRSPCSARLLRYPREQLLTWLPIILWAERSGESGSPAQHAPANTKSIPGAGERPAGLYEELWLQFR